MIGPSRCAMEKQCKIIQEFTERELKYFVTQNREIKFSKPKYPSNR